MQLHLFECKSLVPLRRGLGKNKLDLCMLVLTQLRNTYWSASVIYRLFERAQSMLDKARLAPRHSTEPEAGVSSRTPGTECVGHTFSHQNAKQETVLSQGMHKTNLQSDDRNAPSTFWLNESGSPCFSNVDHLLSPGFFVSENVFQPFFAGYGNGTGIVDGYDQYSMPLPL
jgi:hypothetical protein